jgi:hypothetical protein
MNDQQQALVRELTVEEQRTVDGGVTEGGCIDPIIQKILDIINGTTTP